MTKQEELKAYKRALKDYQSKKPVLDYLGNDWNAYDERSCGEFYGFCYYFFHVQDNIMMDDLFALQCAKPKNIVGECYWFNHNDKAPRIELLKKAIEILEKELK